jgi:mono/diheme cytochrome c family protein
MRPYDVTLFVHSYLRWLVLLLAITVFVKTLATRTRSAGDVKLHRILLGVVDLQFTIGLLLYVFLSPITSAFFAAGFAASMKEPGLRFFGVEHITGMVLAVAAVHMAPPRKSPTRRRVLITVGVFLVLVVASIPWPFKKAGRPLFRAISSPTPVVAALQGPAPACPPTYAARCAQCHGERGHGDGPSAASLHPPPRDFTNPAWGVAKSDADLATLIHEGGVYNGLSPAMPAQPDLSPDDLRALVRCVRSLQRGH